jgi:hypothetical protein
MSGKPGHGGPKPGYKQPASLLAKRRSKAKLSPEAATAIALAMEGLGGADKLVEWAKSNPHRLDIFITQLYAQLIPMTVMATADVTVNHHDSAMAKLETMIGGLTRAAQDGNDGSFCCPDGKTIVRYEDAKLIDVTPVKSAQVTGTDEREPRADRETTGMRVNPVIEQHSMYSHSAATEPSATRPVDRPASPDPPDLPPRAKERPSAPPRPAVAPSRSSPISPNLDGYKRNPSPDRELTTTEKFYLWSGNTGWRI